MNAKRLMEPAEMEARLANAFRPVQPTHKLVQTVRGRIGHLTPTVVVVDPLQDSSRKMLLITGVISGAILLAAAVRAIFYVVNKSR